MLLTRSTLQPTIPALVALAIADGDFIGDVVPHGDLVRLAADYADRAAEAWEDTEDEPPNTVATALRLQTAAVLLKLAHSMLHAAECDALDAAADAILAGDADRNGNPIPYATYRSA